MSEEISKRIDDLHRFDEVVIELRELRAAMRAYFRWTVTTTVALFGLALPVWMWFLSLFLKLR